MMEEEEEVGVSNIDKDNLLVTMMMEHFFVSTRALIMQKMSLLGDILSYNFFI
jgi:hypothetical protein